MARQSASGTLSTAPYLSVYRGSSLDQAACLDTTQKQLRELLPAAGKLSGGIERLRPDYFCLRAGRVPVWDPGLPFSLEEERTYSSAHSLLVNLDFFP